MLFSVALVCFVGVLRCERGTSLCFEIVVDVAANCSVVKSNDDGNDDGVGCRDK